MKTILVAGVLLLAPAALAAQRAGPDPVRDTVPAQVPLPAPPGIPVVPVSDRPHRDALAGAGEGALVGAVIGAVVGAEQPACAPADSPAGSAVAGAGLGAVWGGLRGLLGLRRPNRVPTVLAANPVRPEPSRTGPTPPVADGRCLAETAPGAPAARR